ncbi:hypothetical protein BS50DRAFT_401839 [Corynespora cassiicola Philippines]|uniref:Rhodopsin domain-containing protein n=1 Tax=Corynespora cassiicola Philippines TaxID=1448308 RepID=A0A2T2NLL5_CORCC|nr:hypothetical protein BS50DRAFT_401839 [Corynespora cassiicola Philippines]
MGISASSLSIQSWSLYSLSVLFILSRVTFRFITLGSISRLQLDDWLMVFILIPFTTTIVFANCIFKHIIEEESHRGQKVNYLKLRLALEELVITTCWLVKACLLILYYRIFPVISCRWKRNSLIWISAYCILTYFALQASIFLWCYPVKDYWNPTTANSQCTTYHSYTVTALIFSTTSTILVILPTPFIPTPRLFLLFILLLLGTLIFISGLLSRTSLLSNPTSPSYLYWTVAETSLTLIFANLPFIASLVASKTPQRIRHISHHFSLSQWPRPRTAVVREKNTPPLRAQRLGSDTTDISAFSQGCNVDEAWEVRGGSEVVTPPVPRLRLGDAPLELEIYLAGRRASSSRGGEGGSGIEEPKWPLP